MASKKFLAELSGAERAQLTGPVSKGKAAAHPIPEARFCRRPARARRARAGPAKKSAKRSIPMPAGVLRVRETFAGQGLEAVLPRRQRETPPIAPVFDGGRQAQRDRARLLQAAGRLCAVEHPAPWPGLLSSARSWKPRTSIRLAVRYGCGPRIGSILTAMSLRSWSDADPLIHPCRELANQGVCVVNCTRINELLELSEAQTFGLDLAARCTKCLRQSTRG